MLTRVTGKKSDQHGAFKKALHGRLQAKYVTPGNADEEAILNKHIDEFMKAQDITEDAINKLERDLLKVMQSRRRSNNKSAIEETSDSAKKEAWKKIIEYNTMLADEEEARYKAQEWNKKIKMKEELNKQLVEKKKYKDKEIEKEKEYDKLVEIETKKIEEEDRTKLKLKSQKAKMEKSMRDKQMESNELISD
jgi:hypothetical protein